MIDEPIIMEWLSPFDTKAELRRKLKVWIKKVPVDSIRKKNDIP